MTYRIWYCRRCRRALKAEPTVTLKRACKCEVPILPKAPTVGRVVAP